MTEGLPARDAAAPEPAARPAAPSGAPVASRRPVELVAHGHTRVDDYFWLRDRTDPEVRELLEAENAFTAARTAHLQPLQDALFDEIRAHVQEDDESVPAPDGPWEYATRTREGSQYGIHVRRPRGGGVEQVVLDENRRAEGHEFFAAAEVEVSPDHRLVAWTEDVDGSERYELRFHDLEHHVDLIDVVADCHYGLAWSRAGDAIFYTRPDDAMRSHQVWRHDLGTDPASDALVFEEPDERFELYVGATRSGDWIVITSASRVTTEAWVISADAPASPPRCIEPRSDGLEYHVDHHVHPTTGDRFLVLTNADGAENFALYAAPVDEPGRASWQLLVAHDPDTRIVSADPFRDHIVLYERHEGLQRLRVLDVESGAITAIPMADETYSVWPDANLEFVTGTVRFGYSSLIEPRSVFDYDVATGQSIRLRRQPVPGYDSSRYVTQRVWATADDGVRVPISVVRRTDTPTDGSAPLYHYAYGSYEIPIEPTFRLMALTLLDRGFVVAISHPRGGGELGRTWWEQARFERKITTFRDFDACTRHLHAIGLGAPDRTIARGGSAGGLLIGAVMNLAPESYAGMIAEVPFVDVISTMQDASLPLTVGEWDEWGNPADESIYRAMLEYSPYDNIAPDRRYPRLLVTAGFNDPRVQYWEPAKLVAKLRALSPATDVLLKTEMGAGHQGPSGRYDAWRDEAFVQSWILETVGLV